MSDAGHTAQQTIHASAVLVGTRALLIRGPAGAGKSRLVLSILDAAQAGLLPFARLVGDDRVVVEAANGRLVVRPAPTLAGLIEVRGLGIMRMPYEGVAAVGWVIDLAASDAARFPDPAGQETTLEGVTLPRLPVVSCLDPLPMVLAQLCLSPLAKAGAPP